MIGPYINSAAIVIGSVLGVLLTPIIPQRLKDGLPASFAMISIAMGIIMIMKINQLPSVSLAIVIGVAIGEIFSLEKRTQSFFSTIQIWINKFITLSPRKMSHDVYSQNYTALVVLFCASGTGVVGALSEGMDGKYDLLLVKSLLDVFTALIFSTILGASIALICIPQLIIQAALFYSAYLIMPFMTDISIGDFSACGGIIMIAVGLRIAKIKTFAVINFIPSLFLIIPISLVWSKLSFS